ncbi:SDR family NAD(P)-dependent oxidoreductase [uncultured Pseudomonas sp.]|uniref:SDR family NAD(P)-dependent oxidoreductase n=1 Tax=uncultured Pseudomonas sp. TaxID=114707 RepID=UPI0025884D3D|nr:SDR family NAD(P)-dependent oxidoreductase [uncultured Pseudomonas sp.]
MSINFTSSRYPMKQDKSINWRTSASAVHPLDELRVAVVGGTGGIGQAISRAFVKRGADVTVVGQTFRDVETRRYHFIKADLSSMQDAARVADQLGADDLDMLIFTTGIFAAPERQVTAEGLERDMAVSFLSRMTILKRMAADIGASRADRTFKPRVFVMGYPGTGQIGTDLDDLNAERAYKSFAVHMNTVAGNEMLVLETAEKYPHLNVYGLNPGLIKTSIRDNFFGKGSLKSKLAETLIGFFTLTADEYAERMLPMMVSSGIEFASGGMFDRKANAILPSEGFSREHISTFMTVSEALVARAGVSLNRQAN